MELEVGVAEVGRSSQEAEEEALEGRSGRGGARGVLEDSEEEARE